MPSAPDDADARAAKFRVLTARFACRAASQLLVRNTWDSLWLLAFSDVGRQAVVRGNVNAATELLTFLLTPIISSFTDAHGRRSGQLFCALCNLCYHLCGLTLLGLRGSVPGLIAGQFFFAIAQQGQTLQRASMGDLYMADPVMYTSALSKMELCCESMSYHETACCAPRCCHAYVRAWLSDLLPPRYPCCCRWLVVATVQIPAPR